MQQLPDGVAIYTETQVRNTCECPAMDAFLDGCQSRSFLMDLHDFTFQTCGGQVAVGCLWTCRPLNGEVWPLFAVRANDLLACGS